MMTEKEFEETLDSLHVWSKWMGSSSTNETHEQNARTCHRLLMKEFRKMKRQLEKLSRMVEHER